MLRLVPGGPFTAEKAVSKDIMRNLEAHYGLDKPLLNQYGAYLWDITPKRFAPWHLADGPDFDDNADFDLKASFGIDLGPSFKYPNRTVNEIIANKLPASLELGLLALSSAFLILAARRSEKLARLRTENRVLREERDILKRATVFFAAETR
jgi:oligopeptide transport system permease protein